MHDISAFVLDNIAYSDVNLLCRSHIEQGNLRFQILSRLNFFILGRDVYFCVKKYLFRADVKTTSTDFEMPSPFVSIVPKYEPSFFPAMFASITFSWAGARLNAVSDRVTNSLMATETHKLKFNEKFPVFFIVIGTFLDSPRANCSSIDVGVTLKFFVSNGVSPPPPPVAAAPPPPPAAPLGHAELVHEPLQQKPPSHWFAEVHGCPSANKSVWRNPILLVYDGELIMLLIVPTTFIIF